MSSLKEKAKTLNELLWENRLEWDKWLRMGVTEQKQIELAPKYQEEWVRLEDVEEIIEKLKQLLDWLKMKEKHVKDFRMKYPYERPYAEVSGVIDTLQIIIKKVEELLKEVNVNNGT